MPQLEQLPPRHAGFVADDLAAHAGVAPRRHPLAAGQDQPGRAGQEPVAQGQSRDQRQDDWGGADLLGTETADGAVAPVAITAEHDDHVAREHAERRQPASEPIAAPVESPVGQPLGPDDGVDRAWALLTRRVIAQQFTMEL
jgi:hypothetical protein